MGYQEQLNELFNHAVDAVVRGSHAALKAYQSWTELNGSLSSDAPPEGSSPAAFETAESTLPRPGGATLYEIDNEVMRQRLIQRVFCIGVYTLYSDRLVFHNRTYRASVTLNPEEVERWLDYLTWQR